MLALIIFAINILITVGVFVGLAVLIFQTGLGWFTTTVTEKMLFGFVLLALVAMWVYGPGVFFLIAALVALIAVISKRELKADPPEAAVPTFWDRREHAIVRERIVFAFPFFPLFENLIVFSVGAINKDLTVANIRTRAELDAPPSPATEAPTSQTAVSDLNPAVPRSGGSVKAVLDVTFQPDISHWRRAHQYITAGKEPGVLNQLEGIAGEALRAEGRENTWEGMAFGITELSAKLITDITGQPPNMIVLTDEAGKPLLDERENNMKYLARKRVAGDPEPIKEDYQAFLDSILYNGRSDVRGLGIRLRRMNVKEVEPEGKLKEDAELASREIQQRRGEIRDIKTEIELANMYPDKDTVSLRERLERVRLRRNPNARENIVRSSGNSMVDAAGVISSIGPTNPTTQQ